jgi:hypothetical protein
MNGRPYTLNDVRRAADERRKAARALTEEARRMHLELAAIFEARSGIVPQAAETSNVIQLRPNRPVLVATKKAAKPRKARPPARSRPANRTAPRAG